MALATRCPNCNARFRVAADQLKLRAGLVRCGACQHAFDATANLSYVDDAALSNTTTAGAHVGTVIAAIRKAEAMAGGGLLDPVPLAARAPGSSAGRDDMVATDHPPGQAESGPEAPPGAGAAIAAVDTAATDSADPAVASDRSDHPDRNLDGTGDPPVQDAAAAAADAGATPQDIASSFLQDARRERSRVSPVLVAAGAFLLALLLLGQLAAAYRAEILVVFPQARPALGELCRIFRCTVDWPARHEHLVVVGTELQALPGTPAFELTAVVRNRGNTTLALPAIELTLSDTLSRTVARRVFAPSEYLAGETDAEARLAAGLQAGADLTIRIAFEARGVNAAGFVVYPFYL